MTKHVSRRGAIALGAGAVSTALAGCVGGLGDDSVTETVRERIPTANVHTLSVDGHDDVTLRPVRGTDITVDATKRSEDGERALEVGLVRTSLTGRRMDVGYDAPAGFDSTVTLDIGVPEGIRVTDVSSEIGDIDIENIEFHEKRVSEVRSKNGSISVRSTPSGVSMATTNGDIMAKDVGSVAAAHTVNGDINVDLGGESTVEVMSGNGDLTANIPRDANVEITGSVTSGTVYTGSLGVNLLRDEDEFHGTMGTGGPVLKFTTSNGDIGLHSLT